MNSESEQRYLPHIPWWHCRQQTLASKTFESEFFPTDLPDSEGYLQWPSIQTTIWLLSCQLFQLFCIYVSHRLMAFRTAIVVVFFRVPYTLLIPSRSVIYVVFNDAFLLTSFSPVQHVCGSGLTPMPMMHFPRLPCQHHQNHHHYCCETFLPFFLLPSPPELWVYTAIAGKRSSWRGKSFQNGWLDHRHGSGASSSGIFHPRRKAPVLFRPQLADCMSTS